MSKKIYGITVGTAMNPAHIKETLPAVRYDEAQNLTPEQKAQARANIGVGTSVGGGGSIDGAVRYDVEQALDEADKTRARENIGALGKDYVPSVQTVVVKALEGKKVLCLGDDLMGNDRTDGVPFYLAEYSGATVYNGGIARSGFARRTTSSANVCFDLPNLLDAMVSGNWSVQETQAESVRNSTPAYGYFVDTVALLKTINFSEIDVITLAYGSIDWSDGKKADYVISELKASIDKIQLNFPEMRILVVTPVWRYFTMGSSSGDDYTGYGEGFTLREWAKKIEDASKEKHISVLNAYENMPLSYNSASTYFDKSSSTADGLHHTNLNAKGNQIYAQLICGKLCSMFAPAVSSITGGDFHKECITAEEIANLSTLLN